MRTTWRPSLRRALEAFSSPDHDRSRGTDFSAADPTSPIHPKRKVSETRILPRSIDEFPRAHEVGKFIDKHVAAARIRHGQAAQRTNVSA